MPTIALSAIQRVSLAVELDGKVYAIAMPPDQLRLLVQLAAGITDSGRLAVVEMPEGYKFVDMAKGGPHA